MVVLVVMGFGLLAVGVGPALAHSYKQGDIAIGHAWTPPTESDVGAVYLPLLNRGEAPDSLVGASTPIAREVRIRIEKDGEVRWPETIPLAPGKPIALAAWREHLWLVGLKRPLKGDERFAMTLEFEKAGPIEIEVFVESSPGQ
ncbi:MAG: copper chaperone PCu(A)C [Gammaproteobacteria bacterium]